MPMAAAPPHARPSRSVGPTLLAAALIVGSQVWPWSRLHGVLPPLFPDSRSPSSDVLLQAVPVLHAADQLDGIDATLPQEPVVVVAHGTAAALTSAFLVISMRLWPRPVSLVTCEPVPHVEQFRPAGAPAPRWRLDVTPQRASPALPVRETDTVAPARLCAVAGAP